MECKHKINVAIPITNMKNTQFSSPSTFSTSPPSQSSPRFPSPNHQQLSSPESSPSFKASPSQSSPNLAAPLSPPPIVLSPCAACKILRRRCVEKCVLAPYFPPTEPYKFTIAHRVFGASNIIKFLQVCTSFVCDKFKLIKCPTIFFLIGRKKKLVNCFIFIN